MCAQLHFDICKEIGVKLDKKHLYFHVPESAKTSHEGYHIMEPTSANQQNYSQQ